MLATRLNITTPLFVLCGVFAVSARTSLAQEKSVVDLIRDLTYQSDRPQPYGLHSASFDCGIWAGEADDRALANLLVRLGASAVPEIESALDSIDRLGERSRFSDGAMWLLYAYVGIEGPAAYPRLRRMTCNPQVRVGRFFLDQSVAISFGLTSYVDGYRQSDEAVGGGAQCFVKEPRDGLDDTVLTWVRNDQARFQESLGPSAKGSLDKLLRGKTWAQMRRELWPGNTGPEAAVGYRFKIPGRWSEPWKSLKRSTTGDADI